MSLSLTGAIVIASSLILIRSLSFLVWPHVDFDSDQALLGLMAKHIWEGRAFPLFQYGLDYMLALEPVLQAPFVGIAGGSPAALKLPLVGLNIVTSALLLWVLTREVGLSPALALTSSVFLLFPGPTTSAHLIEALGGNIEPLLFVLLLWILRDRPVWFGLAFAIGFLTREFAAYGAAAILLIEALDRSLLTRRSLPRKATAVVTFGILLVFVHLLRPYADARGPGTSRSMSATQSNLFAVADRFCFEAERVGEDVSVVFVHHLGVLFGGLEVQSADAGLNTSIVEGVAWAWPVTATVLIAAFVRVSWVRLRSQERNGSRFCDYCLVVGALAALVYAMSRCGVISLLTLRYTLLSLLMPIGVMALFFRYEASRTLRSLMLAFLAAWVAVAGTGHLRLARQYVLDPPPSPHQTLADFLVVREIQYGWADYWDAYYVTFLTDERVKLASPVARIQEYNDLLLEHFYEAAFVEREPCSDSPRSWSRVGEWHVCEY